jgi:hypothetical protein
LAFSNLERIQFCVRGRDGGIERKDRERERGRERKQEKREKGKGEKERERVSVRRRGVKDSDRPG